MKGDDHNEEEAKKDAEAELVKVREELRQVRAFYEEGNDKKADRAEIAKLREELAKAATAHSEAWDEIRRLRRAARETDEVIESMLDEDGWPPERLAARLKRLQIISRNALKETK